MKNRFVVNRYFTHNQLSWADKVGKNFYCLPRLHFRIFEPEPACLDQYLGEHKIYFGLCASPVCSTLNWNQTIDVFTNCDFYRKCIYILHLHLTSCILHLHLHLKYKQLNEAFSLNSTEFSIHDKLYKSAATCFHKWWYITWSR